MRTAGVLGFWKRVDGFIIDYLKKELKRERQERSIDLGRPDYEHDALIYEEIYN